MVNFQYEGRENRFFLYLVTVKVRRNIWVPYKESNLRPLHFLLWCTATQNLKGPGFDSSKGTQIFFLNPWSKQYR